MSTANSETSTATQKSPFLQALIDRNPAWAQLLGLCPLLAVTNSVINALGLALATLFVIVGSNVLISALRKHIPEIGRLPVFVLVIATFTTCIALLLEAFAFDLYLKIALFVQIIVTNCMILGRAEAFASRQPVWPTLQDACGTACGFAIALLVLGAAREILATGTLFANAQLLFGSAAQYWQINLFDGAVLPLAGLAPGAFIVAGLIYAACNWFIGPTPVVKPNTE